MRPLLSVARWTWRVIAVTTVAVVVWVLLGGPIYVDRWLDVSERPLPAAAIVVLGGGTDGRNLPLPQGWDRLVTANELFADGLAPAVVFSGGGTSRIAEAEIYANAAAWLGIPRDVMVFETASQRTRDHGHALVGVRLPGGQSIAPSTPLLVVTSRLHARRALLAFHRAGFTHVRIVARYTARRSNPLHAASPGSPHALVPTVSTHQPSGRSYDDPLLRLAYRGFDLVMAIREVGAIAIE